MARTTSLSFPNMFDVATNRVSVIEDTASVINRCRLLLMTEPTEMYNNPLFGSGLKRYLFQYNTENNKSMIKDRIVSQLDMFEPCVDAEKTTFSDGSISATPAISDVGRSSINLTVGLYTIFGDEVVVNLNNE